MKVRVDSEVCQGHGQCGFHCPDVFRFDEQGFAFVESEDVPVAYEEAVGRAERSCPELAIHTSAA